jgi:Putative MetA-pathway of phenol degradation
MGTRDGPRLAPKFLTAVVLYAASLSVWAGPPFRTDDPEAVEYQHAEFYVFYQQTLAADGRTGVVPAFEFNYGVYENVQLHVVAPVAFSTTPSGQRTTRGYGDTELGVKWQFNEETDTIPMVGIFPLVEIPTGDSDKGLGNGHTQVFIPLWLQKHWGDFQTYGGGGYWINNGPDNRNYWFLGWQAQYQFSEHVTLGAEVFHTTGQVVGQGASTGFNVGGYYNFDEHNHLLFSAGKGLQNAAGTNRVSSYVGYQYTF